MTDDHGCCAIYLAATEQAGMGQPNLDDISWGAMRVELYRCKECGHVTRFPRYNDPGNDDSLYYCWLCSVFGANVLIPGILR